MARKLKVIKSRLACILDIERLGRLCLEAALFLLLLILRASTSISWTAVPLFFLFCGKQLKKVSLCSSA